MRNEMKLILASQSPRRRELLARLGLQFTVEAPDIDETMDPARPAGDEVARLSRRKAGAVDAGPDDVVIAADTVVVLDGQVLGKPGDEAEAARMLRALSGRAHQVLTGLTVRRAAAVRTRTVATDVHFRALTEREIAAYVASGEPMDKAGAYGAQGLGAIFIERLEGDYFNVVGLPLGPLAGMLREAGVALPLDTGGEKSL